MDIKKEIDAYRNASTAFDYEEVKKKLGHDSCKKVGAILDILEIGESSIAHAKMILRVCEDSLEKSSLVFGTKRDD